MGFRCKQFTIEDDQCAMKVGTDSLMLGSWVEVNGAKHILDIGTGSGLLAIMLAQKADHICQIEGIDIDRNAIKQAKVNASNSPWSQQLHFYQRSLQEYASNIKYELIVSNPPYFPENISANKIDSLTNRQRARQTLTLDHQSLLQHVVLMMAEQGQFYCVLPAQSAELFCKYAQQVGLYCVNMLWVLAKPNKTASRVLMAFSLQQASQKAQQIIIHTHDGNYSADYMALCQDFYLNF